MTSVILDTDIGTDIDDTWALAMLLGCPELDLRLVTTVSGDTTYRARLAAGLLAAAGRRDVPIGIGTSSLTPDGVPAQPQVEFAQRVVLEDHRGGVHADGVEALVRCVMDSPGPSTVIAIGPMTNVAAALALEPRVASRARLVAMAGSLAGSDIFGGGGAAEPNVAADVGACRAALGAHWEKTITPIDTCGTVALRGDRYARVRRASTAITKALIRNYEDWFEAWPAAAAENIERLDGYFSGKERDQQAVEGLPFVQRSSTILFDTVAVYLAYDESLLNMERLPLAVNDDGIMAVADGAPEVRVAVSWRDRSRFEEHLVERVTRHLA